MADPTAAARRGRLFADTFPQYRLDESPYVHDEFQKIAREFQPYQRQYDQKLRLWRKGGISRAEWEDFLKDNKQARERLRNRMAALEPLLVRLIAVRPPTIYSIHCSTIMGPTAVLSCGWLVIQLCARRRRLLRLKNSLCPRCGYDLRATPDRCPECGNIPEKSPC